MTLSAAVPFDSVAHSERLYMTIVDPCKTFIEQLSCLILH